MISWSAYIAIAMLAVIAGVAMGIVLFYKSGFGILYYTSARQSIKDELVNL